MVEANAAERTKRQRWGWGLLVAVAALIIVNAGIAFFISGSSSTFESDTGVSKEEVSRAYPTVVDAVVLEGRLIAILLAGVGAFAFVAALQGWLRNAREAWMTGWVLVATMLLVAVEFIVVGSSAEIGGYYAVFAALATIALVWARPSRWTPAAKRETRA